MTYTIKELRELCKNGVYALLEDGELSALIHEETGAIIWENYRKSLPWLYGK